ncbi:MAG: hypothetical protein RLZZ453_83 [Chlamydiota bacterium]|jgi:hypothetical protein
MIRKIIAGLLIILGVAAVGASMYINEQVLAGAQKIKNAEQSLDTANQLFSLSPVGKDIGKGIRSSADKKINAGKEMVAEYAALAGQLKVGGIAAILIGGVLFFFPRTRKKGK